MRALSCIYAAFFSFMIFSLSSCVDPTNVGSDLLDNERAEVSFFDTLTVNATTELGAPQITYGPNLGDQVDSYIWGRVKDPIFGTSNAEIYAQPRLGFFNPDFFRAQLDSIILVLPYDLDTNAYYGNINEVFEMDVYRVNDRIERSEFYPSDTSFTTDPTLIGSRRFVPNIRDSLNFIVIPGALKDTIQVPAYLSIPLTEVFGVEILRLDSLTLDNDDNFFDFLGGILLDPVSENNGYLSFDLKNAFSGIYIYYTLSDTLNRQFQIGLDQFATRFPVFSHDYTDATVNSFINDETKGDSLIFVQGLSGVDTRIELPFVQNLDGLVVNKAELVLQLETLDNDQPDVFPPADQLSLFAESSSGSIFAITDFSLADFTNNIPDLFGGVNDEATGTYTLNFSDHFQRMITGEVNNNLIISAFPKPERAYRAVFKGAANDGIKVRVTFSRLE